MDEMSIALDALQDDAAWVRTFADEIGDIRWPAVELAGADVAGAVARAPGFRGLAAQLRDWADTTLAAATAVASADHRAGAGLAPR